MFYYMKEKILIANSCKVYIYSRYFFIILLNNFTLTMYTYSIILVNNFTLYLDKTIFSSIW